MIRWGLFVVLTVGVLVVASENRADLVMLQMLFGFRTPPVSVGLLVLLCFAAGGAVMALLLVPAWVRASLLARRQRKQLDELGREVAASASSPGYTPPSDIG